MKQGGICFVRNVLWNEFVSRPNLIILMIPLVVVVGVVLCIYCDLHACDHLWNLRFKNTLGLINSLPAFTEINEGGLDTGMLGQISLAVKSMRVLLQV